MTSRLIVADDNTDLARVFPTAATRAGWEVTLCPDGLTLVETVAGVEGPLLLLIDVNMPRMDGIELVGRLAADPRPERFRLRFITGSFSINAEAARRIATGRGLACGENLFKPLPLSAFAAMMEAERARLGASALRG